jgi:hypothetical protein
LGLAPNAVAALAYRAREGLRQAYLNAHIQARPPAGCEDIVPKLGAYVRNDLSNRDRRKVEEHLQTCDRCPAIVAELEEAGSRLKVLLIPLIAGIPASAYLSGIGAAGAGGLVGWTSRTIQRAKDAGPGAQVAMVVGAVAAAGILAVGSLAVARAVTGSPDEDVAITTPGGDGGGGGDSGGAGSGGGDSGGGGSAPAAATGSDAPAATDAPPTAQPGTQAGGDTTIPEDEPSDVAPPVEPETTTEPAPSPTAGATVPTVPTVSTTPTIPTTPPTTAPPPTAFSIGFGTAGPAYAGLGVTIPVTAGNSGTAGAVSLGPGRSAPPALAAALPRQTPAPVPPTVTIPLAPGVGFGAVDNPEWSCSVAAGVLQCVLPSLAPGASSEGLIQLTLDVAAGSTVTLTPTISDGTGPPIAGTPLVITVQPQPAGLSDMIVDRADVALLGNAVLTCDPAANFCVDARDAPATTPPGQVDKSAQLMVYVDVDADPSTFNSSTATLTMPAGAEVLLARLTWGGSVQAGGGGGPAPDGAARDVVLLRGPTAATPAPVTATVLSPDPTADARYMASADVTAIVQANGSGVYTVANVQTGTGRTVFGGWALHVVYRDPAAPLRLVALSDQITTVNRGGSASLTLPGLAPSTVDRPSTLSFAAVEGDYGLLPETASANGVALANPLNPVDNPFNGSISSPAARAPAFVNNFGFDADQFAMTVPAGATEVVIDMSSSQDRFRLGTVGLVVPL